MHKFIKPKSMNYKNVNSYISIIGLGPCLFYQLLFEENFNNIKKLCMQFNINDFQANNHLELLQAAKLIQVSILNEEMYLQLFPALSLLGSAHEKWESIFKHKVNVDKGSNISKTYSDVFKDKNPLKKKDLLDNWVTTFEKTFNQKIDASALININQVQISNNYPDALINQMLLRTKIKCNKFNTNYFNLIAKTFKKLNINNAQLATDFFNNNFFDKDNKAQEYLENLENALKEMESS